MKKTKLYKLYKTLSKEEEEDFEWWLKRRFKGELTKPFQLFVYISQKYESLDKAKIWEYIYGDQPYKDAQLRRLFQQLSVELEDYFSFKAFKNEPKAKRELYLLRELNRRNSSLSFKQEKKSQKIAEKQNDYLSLYEIKLEQSKYWFTSPNRTFPGNLISSKMYLNLWWAEQRLWGALVSTYALFYNIKIADQDFPIHFVQEFVENLSEDFIYLKGLLHLYKVIKNNEPLNFELLEGFYAYILSSSDKRFANLSDVTNVLFSFLIRKANGTGDRKDRQRLLRFYDFAIYKGLILVNGTLSSIHLKNVITVSLLEKDYKKVWNKLYSFSPLLREEERESVVHFLTGIIYFHQKDYKKVIELFGKKRFASIQDEISARLYLLRSHYEIGVDDSEWLISQIYNLVRFVSRRHELSNRYKKSYINLIKMFARLVKGFSLEDFLKLKNEIVISKGLGLQYSIQKWLEEKVEEKIQLLEKK